MHSRLSRLACAIPTRNCHIIRAVGLLDSSLAGRAACKTSPRLAVILDTILTVGEHPAITHRARIKRVSAVIITALSTIAVSG